MSQACHVTHLLVGVLHLHELLPALCLDDLHLLLELMILIHATEALLLHIEVHGYQRALCNGLRCLPTHHQLQRKHKQLYMEEEFHHPLAETMWLVHRTSSPRMQASLQAIGMSAQLGSQSHGSTDLALVPWLQDCDELHIPAT